MRREAVADRIVTYSDALVAFSLVNGLAFLIALGEPSIRCSIAGIGGVVAAINAAFPIICTLLLVWLGHYERRLRVDEEEDAIVARFLNRVRYFRYGLVWLFAMIVLFGIYAATLDATCQTALG